MILQFPGPCLKNGFDAFHAFKFHYRISLRHAFRTLIQDTQEEFDPIFLRKIKTFCQAGSTTSIWHGAVESALFQASQNGFIDLTAIKTNGQKWFPVCNNPAMLVNISGIPADSAFFHKKTESFFRQNCFIFQIQEFHCDIDFPLRQIAKSASVDLVSAFPELISAVDRNTGSQIGI